MLKGRPLGASILADLCGDGFRWCSPTRGDEAVSNEWFCKKRLC